MYKQTIGETLKHERIKKGLSFQEVTFYTKIKEVIIKRIEANEFDMLPSHGHARGFIRLYAEYLQLPFQHLWQIYERDYQKENLLNRKNLIKKESKETQESGPEESRLRHKLKSLKYFLKSKIIITGKGISFGAAALILAAILFFGFWIANNAFQKPELKLTSPIELSAPYDGQLEFSESSIKLKGKVEEGTTLLFNQLPLEVNPDFTFETDDIPITPEGSVVVFSSENILGRKSEITLRLKRKFEEIEKIRAKIEIKNFDASLTIKSDRVEVYNQIAKLGDSLEFEANGFLEIETSNPENLIVTVNNKEYVLNSKVTEFENRRFEIIERVK